MSVPPVSPPADQRVERLEERLKVAEKDIAACRERVAAERQAAARAAEQKAAELEAAQRKAGQPIPSPTPGGGQRRGDPDPCEQEETRATEIRLLLAAVRGGKDVPLDSGFRPSYKEIRSKLKEGGCHEAGCEYSREADPTMNLCAPNLSDAIIRAGYDLPPVTAGFRRCDHRRVRSADEMGGHVLPDLLGPPTAKGWENAPSSTGIIYVDLPNDRKGKRPTGHVDLWDGKKCVGFPGMGPAYGNNVYFWSLE